MAPPPSFPPLLSLSLYSFIVLPVLMTSFLCTSSMFIDFEPNCTIFGEDPKPCRTKQYGESKVTPRKTYRELQFVRENSFLESEVDVEKYESYLESKFDRTSPSLDSKPFRKMLLESKSDVTKSETVMHLDSKFDPEKRYLVLGDGGGDMLAGLSHKTWSLSCIANEAKILGRILVLDMTWHVSSLHNGGKWVVGRMEQYINLQDLSRSVPILNHSKFLASVKEYNQKHPKQKASVLFALMRTGPSTDDISKSNATIVHRRYRAPTDLYAYQICSANKITRTFYLPYASVLVHIASSICRDLAHFVYIHVRRGDKARYTGSWPHVDRDTRPKNLIKVLRQRGVQKNTTVYIATNEANPNFFDPMKEFYNIKMLSDYSHLWRIHTEWWNSTHDPEWWKHPHPKIRFDGDMKAIVDYSIKKCGYLVLETFNDFTKDPKHGIHR